MNIVNAVVVVTQPGGGWEPHQAAIMSAQTENDLVTAMTQLHQALLSGTVFAIESVVKQTCMSKYDSVNGTSGGVWTRQVAQWYLRCMNTFSIPVIPVAAYPGQYFPPQYLFTPPPSALIPVVPVPAPIMIVADAYPVPVHNDAAWAMPVQVVPVVPADGAYGGAAVATPVAVTDVIVVGESKVAEPVPTPTPTPAQNEGSAMWVDFDKNVTMEPAKIEQIPFVYAPPADGSACWVTGDDKVPISAKQVQQEIKIVHPRAVQKPEKVLDYSDGDEETTDVWCQAEEQFDTTHLNLWNNDISKIEGLNKFPNLLRLTVSSNELKNLYGVSDAKNLRWLDISNNDVNSLKGLEGMSSLEWLDLHHNEFTTLDGMGILPQLTFLNMRNSDLKHVIGVGKMLPRIR